MIPDTHSVYVYPFEGSAEIADRVLKTHQGGVLASGDKVEVKAGPDGARFLVLAAKPIREPIVQYGPFVMNTRQEIEQAIRDYQSGELTKAA
jgi:redox-sensitive bicupin YhaK (pirin superfamily)